MESTAPTFWEKLQRGRNLLSQHFERKSGGEICRHKIFMETPEGEYIVSWFSEKLPEWGGSIYQYFMRNSGGNVPPRYHQMEKEKRTQKEIYRHTIIRWKKERNFWKASFSNRFRETPRNVTFRQFWEKLRRKMCLHVFGRNSVGNPSSQKFKRNPGKKGVNKGFQSNASGKLPLPKDSPRGKSITSTFWEKRSRKCRDLATCWIRGPPIHAGSESPKMCDKWPVSMDTSFLFTKFDIYFQLRWLMFNGCTSIWWRARLLCVNSQVGWHLADRRVGGDVRGEGGCGHQVIFSVQVTRQWPYRN